MKVLAVVAHSDDEVLGPGAALAAHALAGDSVRVFCLCDRGLVDEYLASCLILGVTPERLLHQAELDQMFDWFPIRMFTEAIETVGRDFEPDLVYLHAETDLNQDHVVAARATMTAFRSAGGVGPTLLAFETVSSSEWSSHPFQPNWFVPLTEQHLDIRSQALTCYPLEVRLPPHPRNASGMNTRAAVRGAQSGQMFAQGFQLIRHTCSTRPSPALDHLSALMGGAAYLTNGHRRRRWSI